MDQLLLADQIPEEAITPTKEQQPSAEQNSANEGSVDLNDLNNG